MKILMTSVGGREAKAAADGRGFDALAARYIERAGQFVPIEARGFRSAEALIQHVEKLRGRTAAMLVLLDERGQSFSSEKFAAWLGGQRDAGLQNLVFAVGPADGWSEGARARAGMMLSLGPMTLAHELARVVLAEQVYRGFTILAGHPYHRA